MGAYMNALREEGTREDLLHELERQLDKRDALAQRTTDLMTIIDWMHAVSRHATPPIESCADLAHRLTDDKERAPYLASIERINKSYRYEPDISPDVRRRMLDLIARVRS